MSAKRKKRATGQRPLAKALAMGTLTGKPCMDRVIDRGVVTHCARKRTGKADFAVRISSCGVCAQVPERFVRVLPRAWCLVSDLPWAAFCFVLYGCYRLRLPLAPAAVLRRHSRCFYVRNFRYLPRSEPSLPAGKVPRRPAPVRRGLAHASEPP